jgi:phthiocerol/phenolphthiocerol synthesis type-I polyketide synthase E
MAALSERLAQLSPERRRLLQKLLAGSQDPARLSGTSLEPTETSPKAAEPGASAPLLSLASIDREAPEGSPEAVKTTFRRFYDSVSEQLNATVFGDFSFFLNYGYVVDLGPQCAVVELPEHCLNRNSVKLVLEMIGDCPISRMRVLDVGCGRGGTLETLARFFEPASAVGVDLSPIAIAFCQRAHRHPCLRFEVGDAEDLPFSEGSFDVVTSVESSHGYPDVFAFYTNVRRVLVPGGHFLYTDVLPVDRRGECLAYLQDLGFRIEQDRDITTNVLRSCDEIARARVGAFSSANDPQLMANFLAVPGSEVYESMERRQWIYTIMRLRKPV